MDEPGLAILLQEIEADTKVASDAAQKATLRLQEAGAGHLEACAYELARLYNVLEKIFERICVDFENHFEKRGDYHERLVRRVSLEVPGIRPAFVPEAFLSDLRELKGFRHVVRHAYELTLRANRLAELALIAQTVSRELPGWAREFGRKVRTEQGWTA